MAKHRARWHLAPTVFLALFTSSGVVGVALGPLFVRPHVEFESSAALDADGGGQVRAVEPLAPAAPAPTGGSRPAATPAAGRVVRTEAPPLAFPPAPPPVPESPGAPADEAADGYEAPADDSSPEPSPWSEPTRDHHEHDEPRCGGWSE